VSESAPIINLLHRLLTMAVGILTGTVDPVVIAILIDEKWNRFNG